jgi:PIN domain nuclease of toxin-antitoxin system
VKLLLDTHLVLWAALEPEKLAPKVQAALADDENLPMFSAASIWEVAIKAALGRKDFHVDPGRLRRGLHDNGWEEIPVSGYHAAATTMLPRLHKDPFDRLLIAQATVEEVVLWTADEIVARYPGSIELV